MDWRSHLLAAYFALRREPVMRLYAEACARQWASPAELLELQRLRLGALLEYALRRCPAHRGRRADIEDFPVLTKAGLRHDFEQLRAQDWSGRSWLQHSGGSTGEPSTVLIDSSMHAWRVACGWRGDCWGGLKPTDRFAFLWGHPGDLSGLARLRQKAHALVFNRWLTDVFALDEARVLAIHGWLSGLRPAAIVGYASALLTYARLARGRGLRPPALRKVIPTAETCSPADAAEIGEYFGAPVMQRYGAREVGDIAHQCEMGVWHVHCEHVYLEVRRDDGRITTEGEGSLLVTCLSNYSLPLIRYEIGDRADLSSTPCSCGRGLPGFARLLGRISDYIELEGGGQLSSLVFNHLLRAAPVRQFQIVQQAPGSIRLLLVPLSGFNADALAPLRDYLTAHCADRLRMEVALVSEIAPGPSGKVRQVLRHSAGTADNTAP